MKVHYALFNPSGNITALVDTYVDKDDRIRIANKIMEMEPTCEQVGFVAENGDFAMLEMAGREFCGNATRCAALYLKKTKVLCSGYFQMLTAKVDGSIVTITAPTLPTGITHKIFENAPNKEAEEQIKCEKEPTGYMFLEGDKLTPLVYVPSSNTLFWENSCASGSMACANYLCKKENKDIDITLMQPGGNLRVVAKQSGEISLSGEVIFIKENEFFYQYDGVVL